MEETSKPVKVWNPPETAFIRSKAGIILFVWVHHISECGRYAVVSYSRRTAKHHQVLVTELRENRR